MILPEKRIQQESFANLTDYSLNGKCPKGFKSFFVFVRFEDESECLLSNIFTATRAAALHFVLAKFSDCVSYITNISLLESDC